MSTTSEHFLSAAGHSSPSRDRFSVEEMDTLRSLSKRIWWVGVLMMGGGIFLLLSMLLSGFNWFLLAQGVLSLALGELTRRVGLAFSPPEGGYGRTVDQLWPAVQRLLTLYTVYLVLALLAIAVVAVVIVWVVILLSSR